MPAVSHAVEKAFEIHGFRCRPSIESALTIEPGNRAMEQRSIRQVGDSSVEAGRGVGQMGWYRFAAQHVAGHTVIDIGCGLGRGLALLRSVAKHASGQDLDPRLAADDVVIGPISQIADKQFDFVTCIDVVEHVNEDKQFVRDLVRIARRGVVMTTPLMVRGREIWPFHVREYTFDEFVKLCAPFGKCSFWKGTPSGDRYYPIDDVDRFKAMHRLLNNALTNVPVRAVQKLLPERSRNLAHQAVVITLD